MNYAIVVPLNENEVSGITSGYPGGQRNLFIALELIDLESTPALYGRWFGDKIGCPIENTTL